MKQKKRFWIIGLVLIVCVVMIAFTKNCSSATIPKEKYKKLLMTIGLLLEEEHYSPKPINDSFSSLVFSTYLENLDGEKSIFLEEDIKKLSTHKFFLDDEIHGDKEIEFITGVDTIYNKRLNEVTILINNILKTPFEYAKDETTASNIDSVAYAKTLQERQDRWRKKIKLLTLEKFIGLKEQRKNSKPIDSLVHNKTDQQLEILARKQVGKNLNRMMEKFKLKYTEDEKFNMYVNTITSLMDPHTDYFQPIEKRAFDEQMSGRFYGIGAQLTEQDGDIKIAALIIGGPAWKSKLIEENDMIVKVGQGKNTPLVDITGFAVDEAVKLIRGNKNTEVSLMLKKVDGSFKTIYLNRDEIVQDEVFARSAIIKEAGKKIGFITLLDFYADYERPDGNKASEDVAKEIVKLKKEGIEGLIIDLRYNGGGSLYEVVQMVGLFIDKGPVVQIKDKNGKITVLKDERAGALYDGPLVVLVNEGSASASEIFAAAIQDYKRGIIVGSSSTFGKGTVQRTLPFGKIVDPNSGRTDLGALKITFEKFYRINGASTQNKGVQADVVIPSAYEYLKTKEKDQPNALPWDEVKQTNYLPYMDSSLYKKIIAESIQKIDTNANLKQIMVNAKWLSEYYNGNVSLNLQKFQSSQEKLKKTLNQNKELLTLKIETPVQVPAVDSTKFYQNTDKGKGERYQAWLKGLKKDFYVKEAASIIATYPPTQ